MTIRFHQKLNIKQNPQDSSMWKKVIDLIFREEHIYLEPTTEHNYRKPTTEQNYRKPTTEQNYRKPTAEHNYRKPTTEHIYLEQTTKNKQRKEKIIFMIFFSF